MIGCLWTPVCKHPIIALYFESENELKFYNLEAWSHRTCDQGATSRGLILFSNLPATGLRSVASRLTIILHLVGDRSVTYQRLVQGNWKLVNVLCGRFSAILATSI